MNNKVKIRIFIIIGVCVLIGSVLALVFSNNEKKDIGTCTEYKCDVKNLRLSTTIEIDKEDEDFVKVSGNIFRFVTDPLTMYDYEENKLAYAGDTYHFIAQDSHSIYVNDEVSVEMVGLVKFFGEAYEIYNTDGDCIATVTFDTFNTNGEMYDMEGNIIADYNSNIFFNDFDVRITEKCNLDEKTVLMIFCSYYSDQSADSQSASTSSNN